MSSRRKARDLIDVELFSYRQMRCWLNNLEDKMRLTRKQGGEWHEATLKGLLHLKE